MISFTESQVQALVTDVGTLKRGQQLAAPTNWSNLGRTDYALWGECAGSGKTPYQIGIDLHGPAYHCNCPSRVFPCKHAAGLLLLQARQPTLLAPGPVPAWLAGWLSKRQASAPAAASTPPAGGAAPAGAPAAPAAGKPAKATKAPSAKSLASQQREAERLARMDQGAAEFETWLLDLVREGLAGKEKQPASYWAQPAARLVDNQLPGLAAWVRAAAPPAKKVPADWAETLLGRLGEVYGLLRAFRNRASLPAEAQAEVQQQVGLYLTREELLADQPTVADTWLVLGQYSAKEDKLNARYTWLQGQQTGRYALVQEYAVRSKAYHAPLAPKTSYVGGLAFYPGLLPLRAVLAPDFTFAPEPSAGTELPTPAGGTIGELYDGYAQALGRNRWLRAWPGALADVVLARRTGGEWVLRHESLPNELLPLYQDGEALNVIWEVLALGGGVPFTAFGEWDGTAYRMLEGWVPAEDEPADTYAPAAAEA